ncbi:hypothetical protein [Desulfococcus multivorans]|uniref:hypothetical protein n=2 Tax=Desulfococcus multivorans TaxID=897 RepID=UPI00190EB061|nr:hypothetical protein [Desulfococcus multivorans]
MPICSASWNDSSRRKFSRSRAAIGWETHWKEETTHAIMDELEWPRENSKLTTGERDRAVDELIALVGDMEGILQQQSLADAAYFLNVCGRSFRTEEIDRIKTGVLRAYRWQYIFSGVGHPRFQVVYEKLMTPGQRDRVATALATLS